MYDDKKRKRVYQVTGVSVLVNVAISAIKLATGKVIHSEAMVVDGLHSLSDLMSDFLVLIISKFSFHGPDEDHPFGHARIESLGTAILGGSLVAASGAIAYDSVLIFLQGGHEVSHLGWGLAIALFNIGAKEGLFRYLLKLGREMKSDILLANAWHSRADAFSSLVVFVGLIFAYFGLPAGDLIASMVVALMIGKVGLDFCLPALRDLTDTGLPPERVRELMQLVLKQEGVLGVHNFRTRRSGQQVFLDMNLQVSPQVSVSEGHEVAHWVIQKINEFAPEIADITVHTDIENDFSPNDLRPLRTQVEKDLWQHWQGQLLPDDVVRLDLHYFEKGLAIDCYLAKDFKLPSDLSSSQYFALLRQLALKADYIDRITFWHSLD